MASLTPGQIQTQIRSLRKRTKNGARVFALRAMETWPGPDYVEIDGERYLVAGCASDLQAREALLRAEEEGRPAVLLCTVGNDQFGSDVLARVAKQRVLQLQAGEMLAEMFAAKDVDPRVTGSKALFEALLKLVPSGGYKPCPTGLLDQDQAWHALLGRILEVELEEAGLNALLGWSMDETKARKLADMEPALKSAFLDWSARLNGETVRFMMAAMEAGMGADLIPLGLVLGVVFSPEMRNQPEFHATLGRMESIFGGREIDAESARAWARAAQSVFAAWGADASGVAGRPMLKRLDQLLVELKLQKAAVFSDHAPSGLAGRFDLLGAALVNAAAKPGPETLAAARGAVQTLRRHVLAPGHADRLERIEMAMRILHWLAAPTLPAANADLAELAAFYHREGGFLDWARHRLRDTDVSEALQAGYQRILKEVDAALRPFEEGFATRLAEWTRSSGQSASLIHIEDVLTRVVAPAAKQQPVLLLVLDGMSVAVFRQLVQDICKHDWTELENRKLGLPQPVLATLPSVTQFSRRALFRGKLDPSRSGTESGEFSSNGLLHHACGGSVRPRLFLKGELHDPGDGSVAKEVRTAMADVNGRLVAMVVNAIDDHLDGGDQVVFNWGIERIRPLGEILKLAAESKRLVILTSDHGHVLDFGTKQYSGDSGEVGDRFRGTQGALKDGEMLFAGPRVEAATGRGEVVLAWRSDVRYSTKKRGYHGGANPQEMVVPLAILAHGGVSVEAEWSEAPLYEPDWWRADQMKAPAVAARKIIAPAKPAKPVQDAGPDLFAALDEKTPPRTWIDALFESPVYQDQLKHTVRVGPSPAQFKAFLTAMEARGGSVMRTALAQAVGLPLIRVDGFVQIIGRILNVDGYEVLSIDRTSETITLNISLLKTQFEIRNP